MSGFARVGEETVWEGSFFRVVEGTFTAPDGTTFGRTIVRHPGAVVVIPVDDDGNVLLLRQYRAALDMELLEAPAGKRDVPDEAPEDTAARELVEEIGRRAGRIELLGCFHNSAGFTDEFSWVYLATGLEEVPTNPQGIEEGAMTIEAVALSDVDALVASGGLTDAGTVIGLAWARARLGGP